MNWSIGDRAKTLQIIRSQATLLNDSSKLQANEVEKQTRSQLLIGDAAAVYFHAISSITCEIILIIRTRW